MPDRREILWGFYALSHHNFVCFNNGMFIHLLSKALSVCTISLSCSLMFLFTVEIKFFPFRIFCTENPLSEIHGRDLTHNTPKSMGNR